MNADEPEPHDGGRPERPAPPRSEGCGGGLRAGARAGAAVGAYLLVGGVLAGSVVDAVLGDRVVSRVLGDVAGWMGLGRRKRAE